MKKVLSFFLLLLSVLTAACADDQLIDVRGRLAVEPLLSGNKGSWVLPDEHELWLGEVPLFANETAKFRLTNSDNAITHILRVERKNSKGQGTFTVESFPTEIFPDFNSPPEALLLIRYRPAVAWQDSNNNQRVDETELDRATFIIYSDAADAKEVVVTVTGYGVDRGAPQLQLCYNNYCGPQDGECQNGLCTLTTPLDFGHVSFGTTASQLLYIKNNANCEYPEEWAVCQHQDYCALVVDRDVKNYNLGLAVKPGSSERFTIFDGNSLPVTVAQNSAATDQCPLEKSGVVRLNYQAGQELQYDGGSLILESNDPRAAVVTIPLKATSCQVPRAVCQLRAADPEHPEYPYSVSGQLRPYSRIYLDGSASYNPLDAQQQEGVSRYSWQVLSYPEGAKVESFGEHGALSSYFDFNAPLSGEYKVGLTVWNNAGISSQETPESVCTLEVAPASKLHVQLTWDDPVNDMDLHLVYLDNGGQVCNKSSDCCYQSRQPQWFSDYAAGSGPNPRLDHDEKNGLGPENLNIDEPLPGRYRLYVHFYEPLSGAGTGQTMVTLRVYLQGQLSGQYKHILAGPKEMWAAVDIVWDENNPHVETLGTDANSSGWTCQVELCSDEQNVTCEEP